MTKFPKKSVIRVSLVMLLALVILIVALLTTINMTRKEMNSYAETVMEQKSSFINSLTNMLSLSNEWVITGYLSGMLDITFCPDSAITGIKHKYVFDDDNLQNLHTDEIYERLESFINYNSDYHSVVMTFEPNVIKDAPEGIAATMYPHNPQKYDLLQEHNIYDNWFYKKVKEEGKMIAKVGNVSKDSSFVSSIGLPLYNKKGSCIGEFWINTDAVFYSNILQRWATDKDAIYAIINDSCRIIASSNTQSNGGYIKDLAIKMYGITCPEEWYSQVKASAVLDKYTRFSTIIKGEPMLTYIFPIKQSTYNLLVIKPEKALYIDVDRFMWIPYTIMLLSIFMISLCLIYIFVIYKKKNDENDVMEGDLNISANIQRGILPLNPENGINQHFDIYGFQRQANTVGGDLYDFVVKGDLLHFCIGDVSGKGMPAALVMTELCSLYRYIISYNSNPSDIVAKMNRAVMERSDDSMFCTLFVCVLNLKTGILKYCNAGHTPPIYIYNDNVELLKIKPNMPIYAFKDYHYQSESLQLKLGDRLFLYTDGVTEAKSEDNMFFGTNALITTVCKFRQLPFSDLVNSVLLTLKEFVKKAEQNDDITMLCIEYKGAGNSEKLHYDNIKGRVTEIVEAILNTCHNTDDIRLRLAIEEPVQNIVDYAYPDDGPLDIEVCQEESEGSIAITLTDQGKRFNPLDTQDPDFSQPIQQRSIGGLGIYMTRQIMEDVNYRYEDKKNILNLKYIKKSLLSTKNRKPFFEIIE